MCVAVTWTGKTFPVFSLSCATFSSAEIATQCEDCVSGPPVCHCSVPGECETSEDNVIEVLTGILDEDVCAQACQDFLLCSNYTFFGPRNPLKFVCFLFSSCYDVSTDCEDCHVGVPQCQVCDFGDFVDGQCS